ncbi:MAG TPA: PHP domain-containing protein [Bacteroidales bacterium]|nr:PHP domain-containing protein [Bacteroidales bacterium]
MRIYRADLHIHTVLSPCGDLTMSPANIIEEAVQKGIDIIGITDHNSTRHCRLIKKMASEKGIYTMTGAEVTTREEVHCLAFFEKTDTLELFQDFLDYHLAEIMNVPEIFGDQVVVDEDEMIVYTEEKLLTNALDVSIEQLEEFVHLNGGLFIPAHIDRLKNGIYGQLGLFPANLPADAIEVSGNVSKKEFVKNHEEISALPIITSSDAHFPEQIGKVTTLFGINEPSFSEISKAFKMEDGRRIAG